MRLTSHRKEILATLQTTHGALSASDIHQTLPHIDLVTIYRSLDLFITENLIKKLAFGSNEAKYEYLADHHQHAVCDDCDRIIHFNVQTAALKKQFSLPNFTIKNIDVIVHGTCTHAHSTAASKHLH